MSITQQPQIFNLTNTIDLIDVMVDHHQETAVELVELALWHEQQAAALVAERHELAVDVTMALREAEALLR